MRILAVGDIGIHGRVARIATEDPERLVSATRPLLLGADIVVGNLEVPIAPRAGNRGVPPTGSAPAESAELLRSWGFTHLSLANNHIADMGDEGVAFSIEVLRAAGVTPFGAGRTLDEASAPVRIDANPPLGLLGYSMRCRANAADGRAGSAPYEREGAARAIEELRTEGRRVVVSLHLGRMYLQRPSPAHLRTAQQLMDAGATLVVCHHSHVPAGILVRGDSAAALGLGELVFDPYQGQIRTLVGRRSRRVSVLLDANIAPSGELSVRREVLLQTDDGVPVPHPNPERVLRRWRRWDRELQLSEKSYGLLYCVREYPRLLAYVGSSALIYLWRRDWRRAYASTLGLLASRRRPDPGKKART